ncbi:MAG: prepilin-type N-terminal cleavage/methylation domain-containing protein, partial [Sulfuriferula multivorans]|nr:prepilin-type N-terminal cleavage/methylation domain-containing protein [Sulfuriferula multivorans]
MIFRTRQSGLSMIELMVTIVISSFLILGVTQVYIDNKRNYIFQQNQSENQESSRFILLFLQQELAKAGYRRRPDEAMENAFPAAIASGCAFAAGQTILYDSQISICIRYQPRDATDRDCLGNGVTTPSNFTKPYTKTTDNFVEKISLNM